MEKIRNVIDNLIKLFKENPDRWENERFTHYDFFRLLFNEFTSDEIKDNFMWEYPVGKPSYGTGNKSAAVDLAINIDNEKWIAIEIELVGPGKGLEKELKTCIDKLKTAPLCQKFMEKGYIVPLLDRKCDKIARGYSMSYSELCQKTLNDAQNMIGDSPIELVNEGIVLY